MVGLGHIAVCFVTLPQEERLWTQLSRCRNAAPRSPAQHVEVGARPRPVNEGRKRSSSLTVKKQVEGAAAVHDARALADLERKLWHAQKARDALSRSLSLEVFDLS
eukprot:s172_g8.t1